MPAPITGCGVMIRTFGRVMRAIIASPELGTITVLLNPPERGVATGRGIRLNDAVTVEREGEFWPTRIAMLAELAHADALAVVLRPHDEALVTYAAHNVSGTPAWTGAAQTALLASALSGKSDDGAVSVPLLDGRTAVAMRTIPVATD